MTYSVSDWQRKLNALGQPLAIIGVREKSTNNQKKKYILHCYKCGGTFEADRKAISTACLSREQKNRVMNWCPICNKHRVESGINDVATLRGDLIVYFKDKATPQLYGVGSHARATLICPRCKQTKDMQICDLCSKGFHCDYCSDSLSLGEKIVRNLILQLPVDEYDFEFTASWTQNKRYDVCFTYKKKKYLVEVDGAQHITDTNWSDKAWQKENDNFKARLALENGYEIIRVKAYKTDFDYIKTDILKGALSKIFDLADIDWSIICQQTVTSRNVEIADYYNEHEGMMIKDIADYFHVSTRTIISTLKKLSKIGLCNYSKEKVFLNGRKQSGKNRTKDNVPFTVYSPAGESLGTFHSISECYQSLQETFKKINLTTDQLKMLLFVGDDFKGYRFAYDNGLYEYHKITHPILFEVCEKYNEGMNIPELIAMYNLSSSTIYKYLIAGTTMEICSYVRRKKKEAI